jgi:hypothetical protein
VTYAGVASRLAEPPRFTENRYVQIVESEPFGARDLDTLNRSLVRIEKLASVLGIEPRRLSLRPTTEVIRTAGAIEYHVLRLWIDEVRGFNSGGMYEMTSESIGRAIIALVFPDLKRLPDTSETIGTESWYAQLKTIRQMCEGLKSTRETHFDSWRSLCRVDGNLASRDGETVSPVSLSPWLTRQLTLEGAQHGLGSRITFLRHLVRASKDESLLEFERANRWPADPKKFGPLLENIVRELAPLQAKTIDFRATLPWLQVELPGKFEKETSKSSRNITEGLRVGLLVVTSCRTPRLSELKGYDAREVVWARVCPNSLSSVVSLVPAENAETFAEKNPDTSFVQVGLDEIAYAFSKGWIDPKSDISDFVSDSKGRNSRLIAYQIRPQSEEWNSKAQAFRVKAPIEVLKLMRLRSI